MRIHYHKPFITKDEISEVIQSLRFGWLTMGPKTLKFEEQVHNYVDSKHPIVVNSCPLALYLPFKAIDLQFGDEVIVPTIHLPLLVKQYYTLALACYSRR